MDSTQIKWMALDSADGQRSLRTHGFIPKVRKRKYTGEEYIGNISLCGKVVVGNEDEQIEVFENIDNEGYLNKNVCHTCLSKSNQP
jgi:hypothetical protein